MTTGGYESRALEQRILHLLDVSRYADAEASARSFVGAEPDSATAHRLLARALRGLGRTDEAVEHGREACRLAPEDVGALIVLADCASSAGDHALAIRSAERAVAVDPTSWATHYTLAKSLLEAPGHSVRGALAAIDAAEELAPWSADVHNLRGMYLSDKGDRRGARAAYRRAIELDPHSSVALNNLATLDVRRRPMRSAKLLGSAAGLDPQRRLIQRNISIVAWNILVYLYRTLFFGGFAIAVTRGFGVPLWARAAMLGCLALAAALWALRRFRHLPRGYRQSPRTVWASFERNQRVAALCMATALVLMGVFALAPESVIGFAWFAMIAIALLMRPLTRQRRETPAQ